MAFTEAKANIKGDLLDILFGSTITPWQATADWSINNNMFPVKTGRTGTSVLKHLHMGTEIGLTITFQQATIAELEHLLGTGSSAPRNLVSTDDAPDTFAITMRPHGAADDTDAIVLNECVLVSMTRSNDGDGPAEITCVFAAQLNSSGLLGRVGVAGS